MVTVIDFTVLPEQIADLDKMTPQARDLVLGVERIEHHGQMLVGYNGRQAVWGAGAYYDDGAWHLRNLGNGEMVDLWG